MRRPFFLALSTWILAATAAAQPVLPPRNPHLADTPYSTFHADAWASGTQSLRGPEPGDRLEVDFVDTGGASSWIQLGPRYPDGSRPIWGGTMNAVVKLVADADSLRLVDKVEIEGKSISDCFVLADGRYLTCDRDGRRLLVFADATPGDPDSPIVIDAEFPLPTDTPGKTVHVQITHDGWVVWLTDEGVFGATPLDFSRHVAWRPPLARGEVAHHNAFPMDAGGRTYLATTAKMMCVRFAGGAFELAWSAPYDFGGLGRQIGKERELLRTITGAGGSGSGTTASIMQSKGGERVVAVVDGREPNNLLLFWADDVPADWRGIEGLDRRVAARLPLPHSTPAGAGFTTENSPVALGGELFCAQWNGFLPERRTVFGAQKLAWDERRRALSIAWTRDDVAINGVPGLSVPSNLVYGSGPGTEGGNVLVGLDWTTGETRLRLRLPMPWRTMDQGNQIVIDDDRGLYFSGRRGVVRVRPVE